MPIRPPKKYTATPYKVLEIPQPGIGGLNLKDLEFEQKVNQSPYMLNMMYRNGSFGKRYGQEIKQTFENKIYAMIVFDDKFIVHSGNQIIIDGTPVDIVLPEQKGTFIKFYQALYYLVGGKYYQYSRELNEGVSTYVWKEVEPYVPTIFNGAEPGKVSKTAKEGESGFGGYKQDDYNLLSLKAIESYNGDGTSKDFYIKGLVEYYNWNIRPIIKVNDVETTSFTMNKIEGKIIFTTAPAKGYDNVEIEWTMLESALAQDRTRLLNCKHAVSYGATNNVRLFLAGGGDSKYFYSDSYDASYFPEPNWEIVGSKEEDITGFGLQYNTLFVFMPQELYSIGSYTTSYFDTNENESKTSSYFASQIVNSQIGCDAPNTIQLIDNKLTWFNSRYGLCTLVSSNILDERNVRVISRNIEKTNSFDVKGILDYKEDLHSIQSVDYDNKYFLVFPHSGMCFMWDYQISPYYYTSSKETDVKILDFYLFDNFYVGQFLKIKREEGSGESLIYSCLKEGHEADVIMLNDTFRDYNDTPIEAFYMTPYLQFDAVEYLKNVRDIYVQCRGDTSSVIDMWYYTEETLDGEQEPESIRIGGRVWSKFSWDSFQWLSVNHAKTFRRKCSLKKIEMCAFLFKNEEIDRDMSISHISLNYNIAKFIK